MSGGTFCPEGGAAAMAAVATGIGYGNPAINVPAGGGVVVAWQNFNTNDLTAFGTGRNATDISHNQSGDQYLEPLQAGICYAMVNCQWSAGNYPRDLSLLGLNNPESLYPFAIDAQSNQTNGPDGLPIVLRDHYMAPTQGVTSGSVSGLYISATNRDVAAHTIIHIAVYCYWWPTSSTFTTVYGTGI